jgi:hypothetical protein
MQSWAPTKEKVSDGRHRKLTTNTRQLGTASDNHRQPQISSQHLTTYLTTNNKQLLPTVITDNRNHHPTTNSDSQQPTAGKYSKIKKPG